MKENQFLKPHGVLQGYINIHYHLGCFYKLHTLLSNEGEKVYITLCECIEVNTFLILCRQLILNICNFKQRAKGQAMNANF